MNYSDILKGNKSETITVVGMDFLTEPLGMTDHEFRLMRTNPSYWEYSIYDGECRHACVSCDICEEFWNRYTPLRKQEKLVQLVANVVAGAAAAFTFFSAGLMLGGTLR